MPLASHFSRYFHQQPTRHARNWRITELVLCLCPSAYHGGFFVSIYKRNNVPRGEGFSPSCIDPVDRFVLGDVLFRDTGGTFLCVCSAEFARSTRLLRASISRSQREFSCLRIPVLLPAIFTFGSVWHPFTLFACFAFVPCFIVAKLQLEVHCGPLSAAASASCRARIVQLGRNAGIQDRLSVAPCRNSTVVSSWCGMPSLWGAV